MLADLFLMCILQNFDDVLTPIDHVSRNPNDTYYVDKDTVRRVLLTSECTGLQTCVLHVNLYTSCAVFAYMHTPKFRCVLTILVKACV